MIKNQQLVRDLGVFRKKKSDLLSTGKYQVGLEASSNGTDHTHTTGSYRRCWAEAHHSLIRFPSSDTTCVTRVTRLLDMKVVYKPDDRQAITYKYIYSVMDSIIISFETIWNRRLATHNIYSSDVIELYAKRNNCVKQVTTSQGGVCVLITTL